MKIAESEKDKEELQKIQAEVQKLIFLDFYCCNRKYILLSCRLVDEEEKKKKEIEEEKEALQKLQDDFHDILSYILLFCLTRSLKHQFGRLH